MVIGNTYHFFNLITTQVWHPNTAQKPLKIFRPAMLY